jgi:ankyrin repeat protein
MLSNCALHDACDCDDLGTVERIIKSVGNDAVRCLGKFDRSPLHISAKSGNVEICRALLEAVDPAAREGFLSMKTAHGFSALYCSVLSGKVDAVNLLLTYAVDLEAADLGGLRPLHIAAEKGYADIVQTLLLAGSDATAVDSIGRTALDWALAKRHQKCVSILAA